MCHGGGGELGVPQLGTELGSGCGANTASGAPQLNVQTTETHRATSGSACLEQSGLLASQECLHPQ